MLRSGAGDIRFGRVTKHFTGEMPCRRGEYKPHEKDAKVIAGGVGRHDSQPWIAPVKTRIVYPPSKNRQTRIPLEFDWSPFETQTKKAEAEYWAVVGVRPLAGSPPIPDPEGHQLPDGSVINKMTFDEKPWLDSAPVEVQAKVGYTNFANDLVRTRDLKQGQFWAAEDRKHREAKQARAADASQPPPARIPDSLESFHGRRCKNCLRRVPEDAHGKVRYCSERCRNRSEYASRMGLAGTVQPGIELSSFAVDGKRVGLDTDELGFSRLLAGTRGD